MSRRLVVVLFLDLVGWTRLAERVDPEPLQRLLDRYYEICSTTVEEHGGVVEKFIGDAIMAVYGTTTSQEDDALRALRTAFQIRDDVGELRTPNASQTPVEIHCGIAAGEALVTQSARAGVRVVGDVVNLAARLQSTAVAGEVLVSETVAHLAHRHFAFVPVAPLTLKGKSEPVPALRATGAVAAGPVMAGEPRMVDRDGERARLRAAYDRATRERRSRTVVVLGPPGIGKTRLVAETAAEFGKEPAVLIGSCPSYGTNSTSVTLAQVLNTLVREVAPCREIVRAKPRLAAVLEGLNRATRSRRAAIGPGPGVEEVSWAVRELFAAAERPLVVVWDGLECAGESLLELIGELAGALRDVPLLMICVARPEPTSPHEPTGDLDVPRVRDLVRADVVNRDVAGGDVIDVGALTPADGIRLAEALATGGGDTEVQAHNLGMVDRVSAYSGGNPLFIRLMVESAGPGGLLDEVPATITAMVGAMIDRLPPLAQRLLGAASVVGSPFTLDHLALLGETAPATGMDTLLERRLVCPTGEPAEYRIVQQPVHEVAYGRLKKEQRYQWHRLLAEHDVDPALHLESAVRLLGDLRPDDAELPGLARRAAGSLLREGTAALRRRDVPAAIGLLGQALDLASGGQDESWSVAAIRLSDALMLSGDTPRALEVVTVARPPSPDGPMPLPCLVQRHLLAARLGRVSDEAVDSLLAELKRNPRTVQGDRADRLAWCRFEQLRMLLLLGRGHYGAAERAAGTALEHARAMGDEYEADRLLAAACEVRQWSPTSIADKLASCAELMIRFADDRFLLVSVLAVRARCLALIGDPAGARAALAEAKEIVEQLRLTMGRILLDQVAGLACALDGEHADAERHYRAAADALDRAGHVSPALALRVQAARERIWQSQVGGSTAEEAADEIATLLERREEMDVRGRILCESAAVKLIAVAGDTGDTRDTEDTPAVVSDVRSLFDDVRSLLDQTDDPCLRGDVYFDLAQAQRSLGRHTEAAAMIAAAVDSYSSVGATRPLRTVRAWM